ASGIRSFVLTGLLPQGAKSVVPSGDSSHAPPCSAGLFVKNERTETEQKQMEKTYESDITTTRFSARTPEPNRASLGEREFEHNPQGTLGQYLS
ncbi:MAG TPA: hypothetical protein VK633_03320, partial [Verrucomicrobiae bacterium]|nr:hypothetical protein [Verrucomicrobiae bacterium]